MSLTKRLWVCAGAAASLTAGAMAQSTVDQSRAYAADMTADANNRTSSLAQKGGDFTVNVHGYTQFRYNVNYRDDDNIDSNNNNITEGFQNARTRVNLSGNIGNENWGYFVQFGWSDSSNGAPDGFGSSSSAFLEDAYGTYRMDNGWQFKFGQFKLPLSREELVGDTYLLFADRSVVNSAFTGGRAQGIQLSYESDTIRFYGMFSDGIRTANTDFTSGVEADWAATARLEWKWAGNWKQFNDFTSFQNSDFAGMVGIAGHVQDGGDTIGTADVFNADLTADVSIEGNGWNVFAAALWSHVDPDGGSETDDWALQIQGGVFVAPQWELIGGFDIIIPDDRGGAGDDNFSTLRLGVNHYFIPESHAAKLTVDFSWFFDDQNGSSALVNQNTLVGLLASNEDTQWNLRAQIQLMF